MLELTHRRSPVSVTDARHNGRRVEAYRMQRRSGILKRSSPMMYWAVVFFVIALVAAFLGFFGLAASAAGVAKILFFVFLVMAIVSFLAGRRPVA
jgi:uncharacterized membrane protein YtjA (UPF0391 family)